jgi:UDP-N-acetylglucosamine--N-acetylmuramyl-(pentapeptide) pyrophosphoryl-undecaprenol N-acetylglucosamine transferase
MAFAYAAADFIISRAGAMSVAELCMVAKPLILVPYPHAAEDHQTANAMRLANAGAAILVKDEQAGDKLVNEFIGLQANDQQCQTMKSQLKKLAHYHADQFVANEILEALK